MTITIYYTLEYIGCWDRNGMGHHIDAKMGHLTCVTLYIFIEVKEEGSYLDMNYRIISKAAI